MIDLNRDGPLEECYRNNQPERPFQRNQNPRDATERSTFDSHALSGVQERPGLRAETRGYDRLNGRDLLIFYRKQRLAEANHIKDSGSHENGQTPLDVEPAEEVPREERQIYLLGPVRPTPAARVERQEYLKAFCVQGRSNNLLVPRPDAQGIPGILVRKHIQFSPLLNSLRPGRQATAL